MTTATVAQTLEVYMQVKDAGLIKRVMESKRISNRSLARQMGWRSHSYINRIISGQERSVTPDTAIKVAHLLGVPVDLFFETRTFTEPVRNVGRKSA